MSRRRIELSPGFHAEQGETEWHLHDVYTTKDVGCNKRLHVGTLNKAAVEAWKRAATAQKGLPHKERT